MIARASGIGHLAATWMRPRTIFMPQWKAISPAGSGGSSISVVSPGGSVPARTLQVAAP